MGDRFPILGRTPFPDPENASLPRFLTNPHPKAIGSYGEHFFEWLSKQTNMNIRKTQGLRWWQTLVADRALEYDINGDLCWSTILLTVPRQQGKSWLMRALILWRVMNGNKLFGEEQTILHVAHKLLAAQEVFRPAAFWAINNYGKNAVRWANGEQRIEIDGSRWLIQAATEGAGVSFSLSAAFVDEAWRIKREVVDGAIDPTLAEANNPQLWLISTAGDSTSDLMMNYRRAALETIDSADGPLILEWSAPNGTSMDDRKAARLAQAHWDERRESILEKKRHTISQSEYESQWLNIWQDYAVETPGELLLSREYCDACHSPNMVCPADKLSYAVSAVEDKFGRGASAAIAWYENGIAHVTAYDFANIENAWNWCRGTGLTICGVSLIGTPSAIAVMAQGVGGRETSQSLPALRRMINEQSVLWNGDDILKRQMATVKVRPSPNTGGLAFVPNQETHVIRVMAWAIRTLLTMPTEAPMVF